MTVTNTNKDTLINELIPFVIIGIPIFVFIYHVYVYAVNLPRYDDYDAILGFLNSYKNATIQEKFRLLFTQHNEHRIFSSRLSYVLFKGFFGTINFRYIILFNSLLLVAIYLLLVHLVRKVLPDLWQVGALALSISVFDLTNYENANFAMAGMQNFGIILFFLYSMYFYSRSSNKVLVIAVLLQILCVFSSGNGGLGSFLITAYVMLTGSKTKRIVALLTLILITPLYYISFNKGGADFFTLNPVKFVPYFLHSLGSHFGFKSGLIAALFMLFLFVFMLPINKIGSLKRPKGLSPQTMIFLFLGLFILSSLGVMSIFRGNTEVEISCSSRYTIYSHLFAGVVFIFLLIKYKDKNRLVDISAISIIILITAYTLNYEEGRRGFVTFYTSKRDIQYQYPDIQRAKVISDEACRLNIYCIEQARTKIQ
jgi:hypothetical protein